MQLTQQNKTNAYKTTKWAVGQQKSKIRYIHVNAFSSHHKNPILLIFKYTVHK